MNKKNTVGNLVYLQAKKKPLKGAIKDRDGVYGKEKLHLLLLHYLHFETDLLLTASHSKFKSAIFCCYCIA